MTFDLGAFRKEYDARFFVKHRAAREVREVYCIGVGAGHPVKIGIARDPAARLAQMRNWHWQELAIYWTLPGEFFHEAALHRAIASRLVRGEWFHDADDLIKAAPICGGTVSETERLIEWLAHRTNSEVIQ
jgi:hypothetical protein